MHIVSEEAMENISHSHSGCLSPAHNCTALACYALADEWRGVYLAEEWCRRREGGHSRPLPLPLPLQQKKTGDEETSFPIAVIMNCNIQSNKRHNLINYTFFMRSI